MAVVLPRIRPSRGGDNDGISNAELDVLAELEKTPGNWIVLHSLWLKSHAFKLHAEADFVILSDNAALIIEVKGGKVWREARDGWHFKTNSGLHEDVKREGPLDRARGAYYAIQIVLMRVVAGSYLTTIMCGAMVPSFQIVFQVDSRDTATDAALILNMARFPAGLSMFIESLATSGEIGLFVALIIQIAEKGAPLAHASEQASGNCRVLAPRNGANSWSRC